MPEAVAAAPIPIRLAYRYPNGCMLSYSARVTARGDQVLRVLVNEEFEEGIQLSVMASFLDGLTMARVRRVHRSRKHPGYYEVDLRLGDDDAAEQRPASGNFGEDEETAAGSSGLGDGPPDGAAVGARRRKKAQTLPELVVESAEKLAYELRKEPQRPIGGAMEEIPDELRSTALLVAIAAGIHLLQKKGHIKARGVLRAIPGSVAESRPAAKTA